MLLPLTNRIDIILDKTLFNKLNQFFIIGSEPINYSMIDFAESLGFAEIKRIINESLIK